MKNFMFLYRGKKVNIKVSECRSLLSQGTGLMFRRKSPPLLFVFPFRNMDSIHSFFCVPFIAIWFSGKKIIDIKYVTPWKVSVKPKEKADLLLEIPINSPYFFKFKKDLTLQKNY